MKSSPYWGCLTFRSWFALTNDHTSSINILSEKKNSGSISFSTLSFCLGPIFKFRSILMTCTMQVCCKGVQFVPAHSANFRAFLNGRIDYQGHICHYLLMHLYLTPTCSTYHIPLGQGTGICQVLPIIQYIMESIYQIIGSIYHII